MLANTENIVKAGRLLRAMAARASWTSGVQVGARATAKLSGITLTDDELAQIEAFMVGQGWIDVGSDASTAGSTAGSSGDAMYALTNHGLDEAQRKAPVEKAPRPKNDDDR